MEIKESPCYCMNYDEHVLFYYYIKKLAPEKGNEKAAFSSYKEKVGRPTCYWNQHSIVDRYLRKVSSKYRLLLHSY